MKYIFDCTFITPQNQYKGIPIYAFRFLKSLTNEEVEDSAVLILFNMVECFIKQNPKLHLIIVDNHWRFLTKIPFVRKIYNFCSYRITIRKLDYQSILIFDEYRPITLFKTNRNKVAIVHDLKGIKCSKRKEWNYGYFKKLFNSCNHIIAISNYTKTDILKNYMIDESKIKVVYNSVCLPRNSVKPHSFIKDKNYILYVNTLEPYKNALTLVKAFKDIRFFFDLNLVFIGTFHEYWQNEVLPYIIENNLEDYIIRLENISNEELKYMYENASLFVTTSLHEGFGYTPIEAAICKCPVVSSTSEALPDTTHNLLNYYEPAMNKDTLRNKIIEILTNPPSTMKLSEISEFYTRIYNPQKQTSEIIKVMNE